LLATTLLDSLTFLSLFQLPDAHCRSLLPRGPSPTVVIFLTAPFYFPIRCVTPYGMRTSPLSKRFLSLSEGMIFPCCPPRPRCHLPVPTGDHLFLQRDFYFPRTRFTPAHRLIWFLCPRAFGHNFSLLMGRCRCICVITVTRPPSRSSFFLFSSSISLRRNPSFPNRQT